MKKFLLFLIANMVSFLAISVSAQHMLELTIIETHKDGEVSVSYDDGEYENDSIDKVDDDDLDMGWEGDNLNIMTAYIRFQNVTIPRGVNIDSAFLQLYAHEDEFDTSLVKVYAEAIDDSPEFSEDEALADRTWTTEFVQWDINEEWTMWEAYRSPDLKTVIQEIINRADWESGNSLTLFMTGQDQGSSLLDNARDFESYENIEDPDDGGDGFHHPERIPKLVIYYSVPMLELTIIETHKDGEVSVSYDDGEYENDSIDKVDDDDLDMGWEGDNLNIMTAYTRFQNVTIPRGVNIDSAFLQLYAHEDEFDTSLVKVYAEAIDDSPGFSEDEALADRTWTTEFVQWDINEEWTMWEAYRSPDLKTVIQEIINRAGWESGNSLTLFMTGQDQGSSLLDNARDFESYENIEDPDDGGDGFHHPERIPKLVIYYTNKSGTTTSVKTVKIESSFKVYPNPADNGYFKLDLGSDSPAVINIFNISGILVRSINTHSNYIEVNMAGFTKGIYFVNVNQEGTSKTQKVILR